MGAADGESKAKMRAPKRMGKADRPFCDASGG
jgi:hypothetical protein